MLHATIEAELWQLGILSAGQRWVAALIRNQTGIIPSVQEIDFYLENNGSDRVRRRLVARGVR
jgi:hypothetical protein